MNKLLRMLGLAKKAGKVSTGSFICEKAIKSKRAKLVILACDASVNTRKSISDACKYYNIQLIEPEVHMEELGYATGGGDRAVVSVNDYNFAKAISDIFLSCETEKG